MEKVKGSKSFPNALCSAEPIYPQNNGFEGIITSIEACDLVMLLFKAPMEAGVATPERTRKKS